MSDSLTIIDNMSDARVKQRVAAHLWALQGVHRIEVCKYRPRRSDRQNRWYWSCFVQPFAAYLRDEGNEYQDMEHAAHEILKREFLTRRAINQKTGAVSEYVGSTATLKTVEFNEYLDKCAEMLARECGITVPEPSIYHEKEEPKRRAAGAEKEQHARI